VKILQNFVAFSEYMNITCNQPLKTETSKQNIQIS
jgi:hypothetical protein